MSSNLSTIPLAASAEDIMFFFYLLARFSGLFLISPLFSNHLIPARVKVFLTVFISLLVGMTLYNDYQGPNARFLIPELSGEIQLSVVAIALSTFKELAVGYLIGFAFTVIFEAILLAGQVIGIMVGLSVTEILDPISNVRQGLVGQLLSAITTLLILSLDLHHIFLQVTVDSFAVLPIGQQELSYHLLNEIGHGTGRIFHHGMQISAIPFVVLSLVTLGLGFMARMMPEMNIFMVGFPLKIFIGFYTLIFTFQYFPIILQRAFVEYHNLAEIIVIHLSSA
ncbi:Flagellar biosynthetic protein FliR [Chlamydiales bacterium SCGC AG-110-P3]|nr:Flagellar biosynthetic protein FliR [Chlamydiales bacterium SCGC AG-110-P3]